MAAFGQKTVVRSYKLRIKDKFKRIETDTDNVVALLQSCVSSFKDEVDTLVNNNDERFFSLYEKVDKDFEMYREKLFLLMASLEKNPEDEEIPESKENHSEQPYSNHQEDPVQCLSKDSSQTFCKTLSSPGASVATSFFSLQDDPCSTQSNLPESQSSVESKEKSNTNLYFHQVQDTSNTVPKSLEYPQDLKSESLLSSKSSSYQSFASAATSPSKMSKTNLESRFIEPQGSEICDNFRQSQEDRAATRPAVSFPIIYVPSKITASLCHDIVSPDDFWMQLEFPKELTSLQAMEELKKTLPIPRVRPGDFCFALSIKVKIYCRAKVLTETSVDETVEVFFIDFGSIQTVAVKDLRVLPEAAYHIPMRAFHCYLSDISPINGVWSAASIQKFSKFAGLCEVLVNSYSSGKYGIELMINKPYLGSISLSDVLCDNGFAFKKEEFSASFLTDKTSIQQVSHDSGVSVTSNQRLWFSSEMLDYGSSSYLPPEPLQKKSYPPVEITEIEAFTSSRENFERIWEPTYKEVSNVSCKTRAKSEIEDLASYESLERISELTYKEVRNVSYKTRAEDQTEDIASYESLERIPETTYKEVSNVSYKTRAGDQIEDIAPSESMERVSDLTYKEVSNVPCKTRAEGDICVSRCPRTDDCDCPLHLVVPPPVLPFVEEGRMLVMISEIVSPSEFYVNPAMVDNLTLDELLEKMTTFYESQHQDWYIGVGDLIVGRFLAGRYEDGCWYRVKILGDYFKGDNGMCLPVQYTDYGNKAAIRCSDLRPLKPEFVVHPAFALECSLAAIVPLVSTIEKEFSPWDMAAVEAFRQLTKYDRCLTAEIVESPVLPQQSETVPVMLWDTEGTHDLLINEALISKGVAAIHSTLTSIESNAFKDVEVLSTWDPMEQEFDGVENSYGVDMDDIGVRISGYKQKDDSRICKYFALHNGYCRNGNNCSKEHVYFAEGGVTRDQEEVFSLDNVPSLPEPLSRVLIQISVVINPGRFYAILPFGNTNVDDIDLMCYQGSLSKAWQNDEVIALHHELTEHYSKAPFAENTTIALSFGTIVAALREQDSAWHRARIINISDIEGPAEVFFVDFGDIAWVPRKMIREILPQYLLTPFQAVECHLSDIEPLGFEQGKTWSVHSINYFTEIVSEAILYARITNRCGKVLHLTLRNLEPGPDDHDHISKKLISAGFAQPAGIAQSSSSSTPKRKESIYVPG